VLAWRLETPIAAAAATWLRVDSSVSEEREKEKERKKEREREREREIEREKERERARERKPWKSVEAAAIWLRVDRLIGAGKTSSRHFIFRAHNTYAACQTRETNPVYEIPPPLAFDHVTTLGPIHQILE
jgi:hypothetical protein